jgi:hypothetical protein
MSMSTQTAYLANRYSKHPEMRGVRDVLSVLGIEVTSRWIDCHTDVVGDFTSSFTVETLAEKTAECAPLGQRDLDDIDAADTLIAFSDYPGQGKGGRHIEFGYALAKGKRIILVGTRENVFHALDRVEWVPDWPHLVMKLSAEQRAA